MKMDRFLNETPERKYYFECPECEYDDLEAKQLAKETQQFCGVCGEDTGRAIKLIRWRVIVGVSREVARRMQLGKASE